MSDSMRSLIVALCALCPMALASGCAPDGGPSDGQGAEAGLPTPDDGPDGMAPEPGPAAFEVRGAVTAAEGFAVDPDAQLVGLWDVDAIGMSNYFYVNGRGAIEPGGRGFVFRLPQNPPPAALTDFGMFFPGRLGVLFIAALPADAEVPPDGVLDDDAVFDALIGITPSHGLVYTEGEFTEGAGLEWPDRFEDGLRCGQGAERLGDDAFPGFEPAPCDAVELFFGLPLEVVGWH